MKLMDKLGITFDDVRAAQKNAAKAALEKPTAKAEEKPRPPKKPKQVVIRNTSTAMGAALAAALAGSNLAVVEDESAKGAKGGKGNSAQAGGNGGNSAQAGGSGAGASGAGSLSKKVSESDKKKLAEELGIGEITLTDILSELEKPSRDPRESMPAPILRSDVLEMKDLKPGMVLKGTVRNVIDFGCFVDIGVHQDGLVHISHITDKFIKHPLEAVSVGDIVDVQVLDVELDKKRISLTMKIQDPAKVAAEAAAKAAERGKSGAGAAGSGKASGASAGSAKASGASGTAAKRVSVVDQLAKEAGIKRTAPAKKATGEGSAAKSADKPATSSARRPASATGDAPATSSARRPAPSASADSTASAGAEAPKKFKKKGIVIFKGNAND